MPLKPGDLFGRYEITELLGKGGMGEVFRAQDTLLHRRVALKVLHPPAPLTAGSSDGPNQTDGAARILREARAAAGIEHPNAIAIYDVGEVGGVPFLAMEFVSGKTLRHFVGDASVTLARRIRWLVDIARALGAAHALGLVHRDIKPENIMVRDDGVVKVLDFGIARRTSRALDPNAPTEAPVVTQTAEGVVVGTPFYMAPEQMRGDSLDGRADQFAWGVLAYELLTGALPWDRDTDGLQLVAQILSREPEAPRARNPEIPAAVDGAIRMALSKSVTHRFREMEDAAIALEPHAAGSGTSTGRKEVHRSIPPDPISLAPTQEVPSSEGGVRNEPSTRTQLASPPTVPSLAPATRPWRALVAGAVGIAVVGAAFAWMSQRQRTAAAPTPDAAPVTQTETQMSANAEATAAYRAGVQALRDGSLGLASSQLNRAITLDPTFAAARLRRALLPREELTENMSRDLPIARAARGSLGEHDRAVLDAVEPWTRVPADLAESARRFEAALKREPSNADLAMLLAWTLSNQGDHAGADRMLDVALESDPSLAIAHGMKARERLTMDDVPGAMAAYGHCLEVSAAATSCLEDLAMLQAHEGKCADMAHTVRRLIAIAPEQSEPYGQLAEALFSMGDSIDAVHAALAQKWQRSGAAAGSWTRTLEEGGLATLTGEFERADQMDRESENIAVASLREVTHFVPSYDRMLVNLEIGRNAEVLRIAREYLGRRSAWQTDELMQEPTIFVFAAQKDAGGLTEARFGALRDEWLAHDRERAQSSRLAAQWNDAYAVPARTKESAALAMATRPEVRPLTYALSETTAEENEPIGRAFLLAGRIDEAVTYLRRAGESCAVLRTWAPEFTTWASEELGEALEARGDTAGACTAYQRVLRRWGHAKPASRTATKAKGRSAALKCAP